MFMICSYASKHFDTLECQANITDKQRLFKNYIKDARKLVSQYPQTTKTLCMYNSMKKDCITYVLG